MASKLAQTCSPMAGGGDGREIPKGGREGTLNGSELRGDGVAGTQVSPALRTDMQ